MAKKPSFRRRGGILLLVGVLLVFGVFGTNYLLERDEPSPVDPSFQALTLSPETEIPIALWVVGGKQSEALQSIQGLTSEITIQGVQVKQQVVSTQALADYNFIALEIPFELALEISDSIEEGETPAILSLTYNPDTSKIDFPESQAIDYFVESETQILRAEDVSGERVKVCFMDTDNRRPLHGYKVEQTFKRIAPDAQVFHVTVLDDNGVGSWTDLVAGLSECKRFNPDFIFASVGGPGNSNNVLSLAVDMTHETYGIPLMFAGGNAGEDSFYVPANSRRSIAVVATEIEGGEIVRADFSNFGGKDSSMVVSCFGTGIVDGSVFIGTSRATPECAGLLALKIDIVKRQRGLTREDKFPRDEVIGLGLNGARDILESGWDFESGFGQLQGGSLLANQDTSIPRIAFNRPTNTVRNVVILWFGIIGVIIFLGFTSSGRGVRKQIKIGG